MIQYDVIHGCGGYARRQGAGSRYFRGKVDGEEEEANVSKQWPMIRLAGSTGVIFKLIGGGVYRMLAAKETKGATSEASQAQFQKAALGTRFIRYRGSDRPSTREDDIIYSYISR